MGIRREGNAFDRERRRAAARLRVLRQSRLPERTGNGDFASPSYDGFALFKTLQGSLLRAREEGFACTRESQLMPGSSVCRPPIASLRLDERVPLVRCERVNRKSRASAKCRGTTTCLHLQSARESAFAYRQDV